MSAPFDPTIQASLISLAQLPWLLLLMVGAPLVLIAWRLQIYPSAWWVAILGVSLIAAVLTLFVPSFLALAVALDGLLLGAAAIDLALLHFGTRQGITVTRSLPKTCSLGIPVESRVTVENRSRFTLVGQVKDDLPEHFTALPGEHRLRLPPLGRMTACRQLTPGRRGAVVLESVYLRFVSPAKLWVRYLTKPVRDTLNVYPDMQQFAEYALLARTNRLNLIGVRKTRRIGQDSDFERLRDYTPDDNYRHIDWRSTARRRKLTVRQFQSDQSQRVMFMLDCGRMMTNESAGYSLLDHAFNSILMMAYVALTQGDAVGLLCFSDQVHSYIPPRGGGSQMNRLLQAGFDQFPRLVESRYDQAFLYLAHRCQRRSLVVLTTNLIDEVNAAAVVDHLGNISGRHLPVGVVLRDRVMFDAADRIPENDFELYRAAAAADILLWRDQVLNDLHHHGVLIVDAFADELTAPLVNQYLQIKAQHLL